MYASVVETSTQKGRPGMDNEIICSCSFLKGKAICRLVVYLVESLIGNTEH
jgi:hypothetical protein